MKKLRKAYATILQGLLIGSASTLAITNTIDIVSGEMSSIFGIAATLVGVFVMLAMVGILHQYEKSITEGKSLKACGVFKWTTITYMSLLAWTGIGVSLGMVSESFSMATLSKEYDNIEEEYLEMKSTFQEAITPSIYEASYRDVTGFREAHPKTPEEYEQAYNEYEGALMDMKLLYETTPSKAEAPIAIVVMCIIILGTLFATILNLYNTLNITMRSSFTAKHLKTAKTSYIAVNICMSIITLLIIAIAMSPSTYGVTLHVSELFAAVVIVITAHLANEVGLRYATYRTAYDKPKARIEG